MGLGSRQWRRVNKTCSLAHPGVPVLDDAQLNAVALRQRDPGLVALADRHDVREARCEDMSHCILQIDHLERTGVALAMLDGADTADVVASADDRHVSCLELDVVQNLVGCEVNPDSVIGLHLRVWVPKSATVV